MEITRLALLAPRYSLGDAWGYISGVIASQNHFVGLNMEGEFMKVDLMDVWTPPELSREFVARLTAPKKAFIPIEGAGHSGLVRNARAFLKAMDSCVRPIIFAKGENGIGF